MELLAAVLAELIDTVVMTLSSGSEVQLTGSGESPAPGVAAVWPLKFVGINIEGRVTSWSRCGHTGPTGTA